MKYKHLVICPINSNGISTGFAPIHVKIMKIDVNHQNLILLIKLNFDDRDVVFFYWYNSND